MRNSLLEECGSLFICVCAHNKSFNERTGFFNFAIFLFFFTIFLMLVRLRKVMLEVYLY